MSLRFFIFIVISLFAHCALAQNKISLAPSWKNQISNELKPFFSTTEGQVEDILEGEVISSSKVSSPSDKEQQLMLFTAGIHPRSCVRAMRKLSMYENYNQYVGFIKKSEYDAKNERLTFNIDHTLLPFPMVMSFKIPRITKAGVYPFVFENGFLKDLKGSIIVKDAGAHCLMALKTDWRGPETKIPNLAFEAFLQTAGKLGLEHLIRVSLF